MIRDRLIAVLQPHGQEHLLAFWDQLDTGEQESLARQIEAIDFDLVGRLYRDRDRQENLRELADRAEPPPAFRLDTAQNPFSPQQARLSGVEALDAGELGVILVAGGQGTRLGFDHPKGMFPIGPLSNKSLFQIHVEKIVAAARRHGVRIPLYLMTSPATHDETAAFFDEHDRFGLPEDDVLIFCQGTMPAVDAETGRGLLEEPGRVAVSPDGHGGLLAAMLHGRVFDDIQRRGIQRLFYFQVDNPLVDICEPEFIGYHVLSEAEISTQVVAKQYPSERVGNVVRVDDRLVVIEYSDLHDGAARRRNADGSLAIWAGSIAVHVMDVPLLRRLAETSDGLPFHIARKKVPCLDASGDRVQPTHPNAIKFERFIFDVMPQARNAIVVEVDTALAFAPLKNASGATTDTPEIVRAQLASLHRGWLRQAGVEVSEDVEVEISPLFALDAEELTEKLPPGTRITEPTYFQP